MAEQEAILAEEIAAGIVESPPEDESSVLLADPDCGPPEGPDAWLGDLASPVLDDVLDARAAAEGGSGEGSTAAEPFPAAFLVHDGRGPGGAGFGSGSVLDGLEPGPVLAAAVDDAWQAGLDRLPDDELAGLVLAWRRCESQAAAGLLAAVSELTRRRDAGGDQQVIEHVDDEIAVLLTLTRRSAGLLLGFAESLRRLPATMSALRAGRIDRPRADVIAYETALLDAALAAAVEQLVIEDAPALTTTGLRARPPRGAGRRSRSSPVPSREGRPGCPRGAVR
jgi:hypothetical protein